MPCLLLRVRLSANITHVCHACKIRLFYVVFVVVAMIALLKIKSSLKSSESSHFIADYEKTEPEYGLSTLYIN